MANTAIAAYVDTLSSIKIDINELKGSGLPVADVTGSSDPYVIFGSPALAFNVRTSYKARVSGECPWYMLEAAGAQVEGNVDFGARVEGRRSASTPVAAEQPGAFAAAPVDDFGDGS